MDNTLNPPKAPIDKEMSILLKTLLEQTQVCIISGGWFPQFETQVIKNLDLSDELLKKLIILPTSGTQMFLFKNSKWTKIYEHDLSKDEKIQIKDAFKKALPEAGFDIPKKLYGELIQDRGSQFTFSAFGQDAPLELKNTWDPDQKKRKHIVSFLQKYIPKLEVRIGGSTSIDITKKGMDKGYGIRQIIKVLKIKKEEMLFIGDGIFPGGNDYAVKQEGVESIQVKDPEETKKIIKNILKP